MHHRWLLLACTSLLWGCGSSSSNDPQSDAGFPPPFDGGPMTKPVQVGIGSDMFEAVTEGQTVNTVLGPQGTGRFGGYHIWGAVKAIGFNPNQISVDYQILAHPSRTKLAGLVRRFRMMPFQDGHAAWGMTPVLDDCCATTSAQVILRVEVTDADGKTGADEVQVVGAPSCPDVNNRNVCP